MNLPYPILLWFVTGAVLFFLELFAPAFVLFFFGIGAWVTALFIWLLPIDLAWQLAIFLASSIISLFLLRRTLTGIFQGEATHTVSGPVKTSAAVGSLAEVIEAIAPPLEGRIKFQGSFWRAASGSPIAAGQTAKIVGQDGLVMRVEPLANSPQKTEA